MPVPAVAEDANGMKHTDKRSGVQANGGNLQSVIWAHTHALPCIHAAACAPVWLFGHANMAWSGCMASDTSDMNE
eukprot:1156566-Pelagomonas_calceolata.AAC.5